MTIILSSIFLLIIAFYKKGRMDRSANGTISDKYKNKDKSWGFKYKQPLEKYEPVWYYFNIIKPKYKERFPFSTTILVFLTDYWHRCQFYFLNCMFLAFTLLLVKDIISFIILFIIIKILYGIGFNIAYERKN